MNTHSIEQCIERDEDSNATLDSSEVEGTSFVFATPRRTLLAGDDYTAIECPAGGTQNLPTAVHRALAGVHNSDGSPAIAVGVLPFDRSAPARMFIPHNVRWKGAPRRGSSTRARATAPTAEAYGQDPQYFSAVEKALQLIRSGHLNKIVLARSLHIVDQGIPPLSDILQSLAGHNPHAYTFAVDLQSAGKCQQGSGSETLVGASPELLVSRELGQVLANPLAGTVPRSARAVDDWQRANRLLRSSKDQHEHELVVEAMGAALAPFCTGLSVPRQPSLLRTPSVWHLSTLLSGRLRDASTTALDLVSALHPTPAVCGEPSEQAMSAINSLEPFDREFYTGAVGWCDAKGDGEWVVTIRCGVVREHEIVAYAGAGIVSDSQPALELAETTAKLQTFMRALGLHQNHASQASTDASVASRSSNSQAIA